MSHCTAYPEIWDGSKFMSDQDYRQFLPKTSTHRIVVDVPPEPSAPYIEPTPNGYDPMGRVYLGGRCDRRMASGRTSWWVLITGWFITGVISFVMVIPLVPVTVLEVILLSIIALLPLTVLWRGTVAKVKAKK